MASVAEEVAWGPETLLGLSIRLLSRGLGGRRSGRGWGIETEICEGGFGPHQGPLESSQQQPITNFAPGVKDDSLSQRTF